eukprot:Rmarinus@m.28514
MMEDICDDEIKNAVFYAIEQGREDVLLQLLQADISNCVRDDDGATPLHAAATLEDPRFVRLLLKHGYHTNAVGTHGPFENRTAYECATEACQLAFSDELFNRVAAEDLSGVQALLELGVSVSSRNLPQLDTPLHFAAYFGSESIAKLLLSHGADPTLKNLAGNTPEQDAAQNGNTEVLKLLICSDRSDKDVLASGEKAGGFSSANGRKYGEKENLGDGVNDHLSGKEHLDDDGKVEMGGCVKGFPQYCAGDDDGKACRSDSQDEGPGSGMPDVQVNGHGTNSGSQLGDGEAGEDDSTQRSDTRSTRATMAESVVVNPSSDPGVVDSCGNDVADKDCSRISGDDEWRSGGVCGSSDAIAPTKSDSEVGNGSGPELPAVETTAEAGVTTQLDDSAVPTSRNEGDRRLLTRPPADFIEDIAAGGGLDCLRELDDTSLKKLRGEAHLLKEERTSLALSLRSMIDEYVEQHGGEHMKAIHQQMTAENTRIHALFKTLCLRRDRLLDLWRQAQVEASSGMSGEPIPSPTAVDGGDDTEHQALMKEVHVAALEAKHMAEVTRVLRQRIEIVFDPEGGILHHVRALRAEKEDMLSQCAAVERHVSDMEARIRRLAARQQQEKQRQRQLAKRASPPAVPTITAMTNGLETTIEAASAKPIRLGDVLPTSPCGLHGSVREEFHTQSTTATVRLSSTSENQSSEPQQTSATVRVVSAAEGPCPTRPPETQVSETCPPVLPQVSTTDVLQNFAEPSYLHTSSESSDLHGVGETSSVQEPVATSRLEAANPDQIASHSAEDGPVPSLHLEYGSDNGCGQTTVPTAATATSTPKSLSPHSGKAIHSLAPLPTSNALPSAQGSPPHKQLPTSNAIAIYRPRPAQPNSGFLRTLFGTVFWWWAPRKERELIEV